MQTADLDYASGRSPAGIVAGVASLAAAARGGAAISAPVSAGPAGGISFSLAPAARVVRARPSLTANQFKPLVWI